MKQYFIDFDTLSTPGKLKAVRVDLGEEIITDMDRVLPIDLNAHPLYAKLETYVLANPTTPKTPITTH